MTVPSKTKSTQHNKAKVLKEKVNGKGLEGNF
jgi:hypothetical protein